MPKYFLTHLVLLLGLSSGLIAQENGKSGEARQIEPLNDKSLMPEEYEKLGMPSTKKEWQPQAYQQALAVLEKLKATPEKLPRLDSPQSGAVFAKLSDRAGMQAMLDKQEATKDRMLMAMNYLQPLSKMQMIYASAAWPRHSLAREQVELVEPLLAITSMAMKDTNEFYKTLDPKDPTYPVRKRGFENMHKNMSTMLTGVYVCLGDKVFSKPATRIRLTNIMTLYVPQILSLLPAELRDDSLQRLKVLITKETDPEVQQAMKELTAKLPRK